MSRTGPLLFNPIQATLEELEGTFVGRRPLLEQLERDIEADAEGPSVRHWLIVGPRGSGKSHLTELLARRLTRRGWAVARLPEEHYTVTGLGPLLEQVLLRLPGGVLPANERDPRRREELAIDAIRAYRRRTGKGVLAIIENLGILFDYQLSSKRDQARLRELLMREPIFTLVATATSYVDAVVEHSAPFYDFFQVRTLDDLSREEVARLVEARANWDDEKELLGKLEEVKGRIEAVYHLSGGNPRLVLELYGVLRRGVTTELYSQVLALLDKVTPYYQARLRDISPQMVRIVAEMALAEGPLTPATIAERCRLPTSQVTANLSRLIAERFVRPGERLDGRRRYYELTDRIFRIWMQMREDGTAGRRLRFLSEFFMRWYQGRAEEAEATVGRVANQFWEELQSGRTARCIELLDTLQYIRSALPEELNELRSLQNALASTDKTQATRLETHLQALLSRIDLADQRESVVYLLSVVQKRLGHEVEALATLARLEASGEMRHVWVWHAYLELLRALIGPAFAYETGIQALNKMPDLVRIQDLLALLAIDQGNLAAAKELLNGYLVTTACDHCHRRALRQFAMTLIRHGHFLQAHEALLQLRSLLDKNKKDDDFRSTEALIKAVGETTTDANVFAHAYDILARRGVAPTWLLWEAGCELAHTRAHARKAFALLVEHERRVGRLSSHAYDHYVEILIKLLAENSSTALQAIELAERKLEDESLSAAFTQRAARLAKDPTLRPHVLEAYRLLRERGKLPDDLVPYSAAVQVLMAPDTLAALQGLHPETREAVELLIADTPVKGPRVRTRAASPSRRRERGAFSPSRQRPTKSP